MSEIPKTDKLFLMLHRAGWSVGDTAFVGKEGISWLVFGTKGDHSIRAEGKSQKFEQVTGPSHYSGSSSPS
jgi:hypothetical protein